MMNFGIQERSGETIYNESWIAIMAKEMVWEVTDWMSGITLTYRPELKLEPHKQQMDSIVVCMDSEIKITVQLQAEPSLFVRLAKKMSGSDPTDEEEVREYAIEYVNVLFGRFISALFSYWHKKPTFFFPQYEIPPHITCIDEEHGGVSLSFLSDMQECVIFSWVIEHEQTDGEEE